MRLPCLGRVKEENLFDDEMYWEMESLLEEEDTSKKSIVDNKRGEVLTADDGETSHML